MDLLNALTFLLLLHLATTDAQECNTPLLRDVISVDPAKSRTLQQDIGDSGGFITGLPLINSSHPLTIRTAAPVFTFPHFILAAKDSFSPHYWITALDIQQGPAGTVCSSTAVIKELAIEVKEATGYTFVSTPFKAGTQARNSAPFYNWQRLGGTRGDGQTTRFSFGPMAADGLRFEVLTMDPLDSSVSTEVCLRVEVYGCERTDSSPPSLGSGPLYQYNLAEPTAGAPYSDPAYSGIASRGYRSGGTGLLTDSAVGGDADSVPSQWVGWNQTDTPTVEVLFLLKSSHQFDRINLFYWADSAAGAGAPADVTFLDQYDGTLAFSSEVISFGDKVRALSFSRDTAVLSSYLKVRMGYAAGAGLLLLTEVELVSRDGINVLTGNPASITTSPTPAPPTTLATTAATTAPTSTTTVTSTTSTTSATSTPDTTPVTTPTTIATTTVISTPTTTPTTEVTTVVSSTVDTTPYTQSDTSTQTPDITTTEETGTSTPPVATVPPSPGSGTPVAPTEAELREQLIVGLIFGIIMIIIIVLTAILIVSVFYYMRSTGMSPRELLCLGRDGQFKKLWDGDAETGTAGRIRSRIRSVSLLKRGRDPVYEPVKGLTPLDISGPVLDKPEPELTEADPPPDTREEDLHIYAPLSEVMPIYATIQRERSRVYSEPQLDLSLPSTPLDGDQGGRGQPLQPPGSLYESPELLTQEEGPRVLAWKDIEEHELLGNGLFGEVCLALLVNYSARDLGIGASERMGVEIAIKKLSGESSQQTKDSFSNEVRFMARLDHPNVIRLIGVCLDASAGRFLAMEYMINGDLAQFLKESDYVDSIGANLRIQEVNQDCMVYMGQQIASGMEYLSDRNYIHRDLSARNCLVGTNYTVKVADFGMSQNLYSSEYFKITGRATLPIRWMPNESFYGKFTLKSDVWAFGVTLWEIFCKCQEKPYPGLSDHELIQDVLANKEDRVRLERPPYAPEEGWDLVLRCTDLTGELRPNFGAVRRELEDMCKFQIEEINI